MRDNFIVDYINDKKKGSQISQHKVGFKIYGNIDGESHGVQAPPVSDVTRNK
jgi:hypothetical protein